MTRTSPVWVQECVVIYLRIPAEAYSQIGGKMMEQTVVEMFPGEAA